MTYRPKKTLNCNSRGRKDTGILLSCISLVILLMSLPMFDFDANSAQENLERDIGLDLHFKNNDPQFPLVPREKTSTRSQPDYYELISYDDVLIIRNLNSPMSMQIADYFQAKRNISNLNICNITTSTTETVSRNTFENEIRGPVEDHIINNSLLGTINFILTTKGVPLRVAEEDTSDDDWNQPWTIDRASVDAELALILGPYKSSIGAPWWINNPYFDPSPYDEFSFLAYGFFLVSRLTGYDFNDIKAMIDNAEMSIGRKGIFVLDVDPGRDGGSYQVGNDWMRDANTTLTANGFDVFLDETNTFLTNQSNTSGYTSWGSNDGNYPTNSILNPGFENDANGDDVPDNWYFIEDSGVGSCDRNDIEVRNGAWSVRISRTTTNDNASYVAQNFTVKPDTRYYAAGYANLSGVSSDMGVHLQIKAYDSLGNIVKYYNGSTRTGTTGNWVSLSQVHFEPLVSVTNISVGAALSKSSGTVFIDDMRLYEIKPHNDWIPGALAETYVSTGGRSFNYPTTYGQSLVADLIRDGVTGVKGYVYEPYLSACAHPDILFDAYTQGFFSAESYYMASGYLGWMDCVVGDPKVSPYDIDIIPDLAIISQDISFSDSTPQEGEVIDILADIQNLGSAPVSNVEVGFYAGDPFGGGIYLGSSAIDIDGSGSNSTSLSWNTSGYLGDYNITLIVDPNDLFYELNEINNMANTTITVNKGYPVAEAGLDGMVDEDFPYTFNASSSTDNTSIANYTWDFGDGNFGYGVSPNHTFTSQGLYVVVLNVTNVYGLWDKDIVNITVNNIIPSAEAGLDKTGFEGQPLNFNASGSTDTPSDIASLNYTWDFGDGVLGYGINITHVYQDNGTYTVNLFVRDDDFAFDMDILNVTLNNSSPFLEPVPLQIIQEDAPFNLNIIASDVSGDTITFSDNSSIFDIDPVTGEINFTPRNEDVGIHLINISARDDDGGESFIEFLITVENTNDPPYIVSSPITEAVEENLYQYDVVVEDEDMLVSPLEVITYSFDSAPAGMEIDSQGRITWIPTDFQASQIFNVIVNVSDDQAYDLQVFDITVTNINDEPVIISSPITSAIEDTYYTYDLNASDVDTGDWLTYKLDLAPQGMIIDESSGVISWLPTNDFVGNNEVIVNVTDIAGAYDTQEFFIIVSNTNDEPVIISLPITLAVEDVFYSYDVNASDVDIGDVLTYKLDISPQGMIIDESSGVISWLPTNDFVGNNEVIVNVTDSSSAYDAQEFIIFVSNTNDAPELEPIGDLEATEDLPFYYQIRATDVDSYDVLSFYDNSELFEIDKNTGIISFTPTNDDVRTYILKITVKDNEDATDSETIIFTVLNMNDPPALDFISDFMLIEDIPFTFVVTASDIDAGDSITFLDNSTLFDIDPYTGEISFSPTNEDVGVHYINISVLDENGGINYQTVTFIIENVNDPPSIDEDDVLILSDVVSLSVGETFTYQINAFDEDIEDTLIFSDDTDLFDIDPTTGEITFTPEKKDVGMHIVEITVTDEEGDSDDFIVTFEVVGEEDDEGIDLIWLWLVLVLVIAIIIIIAFVLWKGKKVKPSEEPIVVEVYEQGVVRDLEWQKQNFPPPPPPLPPPPPPP